MAQTKVKLNLKELGIKEEDVLRYIELGLQSETSIKQLQDEIALLKDGIVGLANGDFEANIPKVDGDLKEISESTQALSDVLSKLLVDYNAGYSEIAKGNVKARVTTEGFKGDFLKLVGVVNDTLTTVDGAFADTVFGLNALENGKFDARITTEYQGDFDVVKQAANNTAAQLEKLLKNYNDGYAEIEKGNISARVDSEGFGNDYLKLIAVVNNTL